MEFHANPFRVAALGLEPHQFIAAPGSPLLTPKTTTKRCRYGLEDFLMATTTTRGPPPGVLDSSAPNNMAATALQVIDHRSIANGKRKRQEAATTLPPVEVQDGEQPPKRVRFGMASNAVVDENGGGKDSADPLLLPSSSQATALPPPTVHFMPASSEWQPHATKWYTNSELKKMKRSAREAAVCNRGDLEFLLNQAYCCGITQSAAQATTDPRLALPLSSSGSESFSREVLLNHPRFLAQRGLERCSSLRQAVARHLTILQVKTEVYLAQAGESPLTTTPLSSAATTDAAAALKEKERQELNNHHHDDGQHSSPTTTAASALAETCRTASQPAVKFARLLGELDAIVAAREHHQGA